VTTTTRERAGSLARVLLLDATAHARMIAHAYDGLPLEACGLLVGRPGGAASLPSGWASSGRSGASATCVSFHPTDNLARSAKVYTVDPRAHLRVERDAEDAGLEVIGVMHSHTHTDAYPSPTDVAQAPDPGWHYVIVSLREEAPVLRSYRIVDGKIAEEPVVVIG